MHHLSFRHKLRTLAVAAGTGCVTNLEVAWRLLQPCTFPELLQGAFYLEQLQGDRSDVDDPGTAAAKGGSMQAVAWLQDRCPSLVHRSRTLEAAAKHLPLLQLQEAWELLSGAGSSSSSSGPRLDSAVLCAAAESTAPDALAKMDWVLEQGQCLITGHTATAAARSGDLARLQWLRERGWRCDNWGVLEAALRHTGLAVADWLLDEAGCPLPDLYSANEVASAAAASGSVDKLRWLQACGVGLHFELWQHGVFMEAAGLGDTGVMQFLLEQEGGAQLLNSYAMDGVLSSGNVAAAALLLRRGCGVAQKACRTWCYAGCKGGLAMLRWLLDEVHVPPSDFPPLNMIIAAWPSTIAADSWQLLAGVRLLHAAWLQLPAEERVKVLIEATMHAARRGDPGLLRYLHEELGARLEPRVLEAAVHGGCEAVLEWLVARGCAAAAEDVGQMDACYLEAGERGDRGTLECLKRLGVPRSEVLWLRARNGAVPEPVLRWIQAAGRAGV